MKRLTWLIVCLATLLVLGACGDGGGSGGNNGDNGDTGTNPDAGGDTGEQQEEVDVGPLNPQTFKQQYVLALNTAICETAFNDCPNRVRHSRTGRRTTSAEECIAELEAFVEGYSPSLEEGAVFDEDAARECLENIITKQRADVCYVASPADRAACDDAVTGTFADGENCLSYEQCESGACNRAYDPDNPDVCWGTCVLGPEIVGEGEVCEYGVKECDAAQNLLCDVASGSDERMCVALNTREEGDSCLLDATCTDGLVCIDGTCSTFELGQVGDDCLGPPPGSTAASSMPCKQGLVCAGLDASNNGTCAELGADGDACGDTDECKYGLYCNADDGTCAPTKAEGEECVDSDECGRYLDCMWSDGDVDTCQPMESHAVPACTLPDDSGSGG